MFGGRVFIAVIVIKGTWLVKIEKMGNPYVQIVKQLLMMVEMIEIFL